MKRIKKTIKIIENEKECVKQAKSCDRNCVICPLVKDDKEIIAAYDYALEVLHNVRKDEYIRKDKLIHTINRLIHSGDGKKKSLEFLNKIIMYDREIDNL